MAAKRTEKARSPQSDRLRVAVCIDTRDGPGRERLLGVYEYAVQRNWDLFLVRHVDKHAVAQVAALGVDGAILYDRDPGFHRALRRRGVYCVETSARNLEHDDAAVFVDDEAVGLVAAQHLAGLGLERFVYCSPHSGRHAQLSRRGTSFCDHLRGLGHEAELFTGFSVDGDTPLEPLVRWLRRLPGPAGLFAFDDKVGERLLAASRLCGRRVPEDVAVVGVGNDELICELVAPKLSSVVIPTREIGRRAAEAVEAHHAGRRHPRHTCLTTTEVVVRASSERLHTEDPAVAAAIDMIKARAHQPFGTDQLVEALRIPRRTLERRFRAGTGRTVHDFIIDCRLSLAKRLLRRTHGNVSEVARQCGYAALSAFTRMFAERTGLHPEEYRRRGHQLA